MERKEMNETQTERALRKARTQRATNIYGVGATQLLRGMRQLQTDSSQEEE